MVREAELRWTLGAWLLVFLATGPGCSDDLPRLDANLPPQNLVLNATPVAGNVPLTVTFTGSALDPEGGLLFYTLDFGDGTGVSTSPNDTHVYQTAGLYTAMLQVRDEGGLIGVTGVQINAGCVSAAQTSFLCDVVPLFSAPALGCTGCHSVGFPSGGLSLTGTTNEIYDELVNETPFRVVVADPPTSQVLTRPLGINHVTRWTTTDPEYVTVLNWIEDGAQNN